MEEGEEQDELRLACMRSTMTGRATPTAAIIKLRLDPNLICAGLGWGPTRALLWVWGVDDDGTSTVIYLATRSVS